MAVGRNKIKEDFLKVEEEIKMIDYNVIINEKVTLNLKHIHKITYTMCIWKAFLSESKYDEKIKISISEIFSTYIQILYIIPLKDVKILKLLERNIIDNFIKIMKIRNKITERETEEVFDKIMSLNGDKEYTDSIVLIKRFYKDSSNYVHSTNEENCSLIDGVKRYVTTGNSDLDNIVTDLFRLGKCINYILILIFSDIYSQQMNRINRDILLQSVDNSKKAKISSIFY